MHIAICDDENEWISRTENHLIRLRQIHKNITWEVFWSGEEVLEHYKAHGNVFDILITDIEMSGINGVELANKVRELDREMAVFFLSDNEEYMRDCFASGPMDFWNKPVEYDTFAKGIERVMAFPEARHKFFSLTENRVYRRIPYNDIIYFLNKGRKIIVHTQKRDYEFYGSFRNYSDVWRENHFYIVSRFLCINEDYIAGLKNDALLLSDGTKMKISHAECRKIKQLFFQNNCG